MNPMTRIPAVLLLCATGVAQAAPVTLDGSTVQETRQDDAGWGIGATTGLNDRPFVGVDSQQESLPYLSGQAGRFAVEGLDFTFNVAERENRKLHLIVTPRFYEVKDSFAKNGELNGISTTKDTWFAGVNYRQPIGDYHLIANAIYDIGNESDGTEISLAVNRVFRSGELSLIPSAGLVWQDENLVDHFYGVTLEESTPTRPVYQDESSLNVQASVTAVWQPHQNWRLLGAVKGEKLGSGIGDSPIINDDVLGSALIGVVYQF